MHRRVFAKFVLLTTTNMNTDIGNSTTLRIRITIPFEDLNHDPIENVLLQCVDKFNRNLFILLASYQQRATGNRCWIFSDHVYEVMKPGIPPKYMMDFCSLTQAMEESNNDVAISLQNGN